MPLPEQSSTIRSFNENAAHVPRPFLGNSTVPRLTELVFLARVLTLDQLIDVQLATAMLGPAAQNHQPTKCEMFRALRSKADASLATALNNLSTAVGT